MVNEKTDQWFRITRKRMVKIIQSYTGVVNNMAWRKG